MNIRLSSVALLGVLQCACVSMPSDRGRAETVSWLQSRSTVAAEVRLNEPGAAEELAEPLDVEAAVRVALNRSPQLLALYAQLGLTQAEVYDATRLTNPSLGFMQASVRGSNASRSTWSLTQNFTELLFMNYRQRQGRSLLLQARLRVAQSVLDLEAQVRSAYYRQAVSALVAQLHEQSTVAAGASADYAQALFNAGTISELQLSREQANASQARIAWRTAQSEAQRQRAALLTLMGVSWQERCEFVDRLEVPRQQALQADSLQEWAKQQRVDLALLREQISMLDAAQHHARRWFWLSDAQLQLEREDDTDGARLNGVGGSVSVPLFNQGAGTRLRAQSQLERTQAELAITQLSLRNDLIVQLEALARAAEVVDEYRQRLVPLQERVLELSQQQQNFMLIGAFELLAARRELLQTYQDYLAATGQYWLNHVELSRTVGGRLPESAGEASDGISIGVDALPEPDREAAQPATPSVHPSSHTGETP